MQAVSKSEFARRMGVSRQYIGRIVREGKLPQLPDGRLDFDECAIQFQVNREQSDRNNQKWIEEQKGIGAVKAAEKRVTGEEPKKEDEEGEKKKESYGVSYQKARAASEAVKVRKAQIELLQLENKLIDVQDAKRQIEFIANTIRTRLDKFPSKYAGRLEGLTTVEIEETLKIGIYEILSEFRDMIADARETVKK